MKRRKRLLHVITGLGTGGAEMMLFKLLSRLDRNAFEPVVLSLTDIGPIGAQIAALDIPVRALGMRPGVPDPTAVLRLAGQIRALRPHLVQTWMYHADLLGGLAAHLAGRVPTVWGIRRSAFSRASSKPLTLWTTRACARLSRRLPARIVCCSHAAQTVHARIGYAIEKMTVIPNGFDLDACRPDPRARRDVRAELGIASDALLVGMVARFNPDKDHATFLGAAARLGERLPDAHFLLCGDGVTIENAALAAPIAQFGLGGRVHLLGRRRDVSRIHAALDVAALSSRTEGFPNVLGEAMACGVPCAATDVGDAAGIVGETGRIVPPENPAALADAWAELLRMTPGERAALGASARRRIEENFSLPAIAGRYERVYWEVASPCAD